jgi:hypothetical protein
MHMQYNAETAQKVYFVADFFTFSMLLFFGALRLRRKHPVCKTAPHPSDSSVDRKS